VKVNLRPAEGPVRVTGTATSSTYELDPSNNTATATTTVTR
jgi:hypothetical protein